MRFGRDAARDMGGDAKTQSTSLTPRRFLGKIRGGCAATAMRNGRSDLKDATVEITNAFLIAISNSFSCVPVRCSQTPQFNMALTVDSSDD